jgi:hypothetical protein
MDPNDISLETKQELAEKAAGCLMEYGAAAKFVVVNSAFHEVRIRVCLLFDLLDTPAIKLDTIFF